jgi:hypothetical protein
MEEETLLDGLARRLGYAGVGVGVVLAVGSTSPAPVGLALLAVWFLPLFCHAGLRQFALILAVGIAVLAGPRSRPQLFGLFATQVIEECVLVLTVAFLGVWLL